MSMRKRFSSLPLQPPTYNLQPKKGFSLIELLIVIAILAILGLAAYLTLNSKRDQATDAKVKSELERLKIAFEDYYNDNNCYPPADWFDSSDDCGSGQLRPYMSSLPCNPKTNLPYTYETDATGCSWFKLYGNLSNPADTSSLTSTVTVAGTTYNYAVASSNVILDTGGGITYDPTHPYYCSGVNNCTAIPAGRACSPAYETGNCDGTTTGTKCSSVGTCVTR
jgi:prepilin-type N-terminal cleavage/methylation domain-containing protein